LGTLALYVAVASAVFGLAAALARPAGRPLGWCRWVLAGAVALALGALAVLVAGGDATTRYAAEHRAPATAPWGYRGAAVWAGQAGGLLLWSLELALVSLALPWREQGRALAVLFAVQGCLLALASFHNPFAPAPAGFGVGLNPLLQHPMMLIHPPLLFLGYALLAMPFAITLGALLGREPAGWPAAVRPWLLVAWLALSAGNGFGAAWAYKTFGWGGFWGWDPVENTSFVPWVLAGAALHALYLARYRVRWLRLAAACSLLAFVAVLYGSFLARSGMLAGASVHAYVGGERLLQWTLALLLAGASVASLAAMALAWRGWRLPPSPAPPPTGPAAGGTWLLVVVALLVLAGMSLPMGGLAPSAIAYNVLLLPFALALLVLLARSLAAPWRPGKAFWVVSTMAALAAGAVIFLRLRAQVADPVELAIFGFLGPPLLAAGLAVAGLALRQLGRRPWRRWGSPLAHLGLALLLVGTLLSGCLSRHEQAYLPFGETRELAGHRVRAGRPDHPSPERTRAWLLVDGQPATLEVEHNRNFNLELRRPWVQAHLWGDLYLAPLAILPEPQGRLPAGVMLSLAVKPGMRLVWLGMWLVGVGLALALAAPAKTATRDSAGRAE